MTNNILYKIVDFKTSTILNHFKETFVAIWEPLSSLSKKDSFRQLSNIVVKYGCYIFWYSLGGDLAQVVQNYILKYKLED